MNYSPYEHRLTAVLGPTNTGKTYLAIDRMLGHASGMIGFPLRLLARENYDRVRKLRGANAVALITGEERILPPNPRYFLCTVEAMPLEREVEFLAIDEIQMCADPERGHVFTDRLLHARGTEETMFLGAETIKPLIARLVPGVQFESRPRFSKLSYAGHKKVTRLPPRSAVIGFSATNVYALAELIRRQRGGAAIVLGALSPRTRNAQVALYEEGDVDYLVATDAIGMGLNMAISHVAFSAISKFDGRQPRQLTAAELAQIAGRAGRHTADGTFGTTAAQGPFSEELVTALESHQFEPLKQVYWRNRDLDYASPAALKASLDQAPPRRELARARIADDYAALAGLVDNAEIGAIATHPDAVRTLWAVCQIPNFRNEVTDGHQRLAARIFKFLMKGDGVVPTDWAARAIERLDRTDGDIDTLVGRIAHIRTWTYISHRADWLHDAGHWQERTRRIEDALSDALHERLAQKFVDARATTLLRRLDRGGDLLAAVTSTNDVIVEGAPVGRLVGFRFADADFRPDTGHDHAAAQIAAAAKRALRFEISRRVAALTAAPASAFGLRADGTITWANAPVARVAAGADLFHPTVEMLPTDLLEPRDRDRVARHLGDWLSGYLTRRLPGLAALQTAELKAAARGLAWQLLQGLGSVAVRDARAQLDALSADEKNRLTALGVQFGVHTIFIGSLTGQKAMALRAILWRAHHGPASLPPRGAIAVPRAPELNAGDYLALGYSLAGSVAVRTVDLEKCLLGIKRRLARGGVVLSIDEAAAYFGQSPDAFARVLKSCGLRAKVAENRVVVQRPRRGTDKANGAKRRRAAKGTGDGTRDQKPASAARHVVTDGPFAKLRRLHSAD